MASQIVRCAWVSRKTTKLIMDKLGPYPHAVHLETQLAEGEPATGLDRILQRPSSALPSMNQTCGAC